MPKHMPAVSLVAVPGRRQATLELAGEIGRDAAGASIGLAPGEDGVAEVDRRAKNAGGSELDSCLFVHP